MKFDEFVSNTDANAAEKAKRASEIRDYEVAVIPCGSDMIGRVGALRRAMAFYEPELYTYRAFGFTLFSGFGDHGTIRSSNRGVTVSENKDGSYSVKDNISYGISHRLQVGVFGIIDMAKVSNAERFNDLLGEARRALDDCKRLMVENSGDAQYAERLKQAFFEKIDELGAAAQNECGIAPTADMDEIRADILRACRRKSSCSKSEAKRIFTGESSGTPKKKGSGIGLLIAVAAVVALVVLLMMIDK